MLCYLKFFAFSYFICVWVESLSLTVIPERGNLTMLNTKYIEHGVFNIRRYNRQSPYVMNLFGVTKKTFGNNLTVDLYFSEFLHNEYRRTFIEGHYKLCDLVNTEAYIGGMFRNAGGYCPLPPGEHRFMNMTIPGQNFPNVFPFSKGRVDALFSIGATKEPVLQIFVTASFKQKTV